MPLADFWEKYGDDEDFEEIECSDAGTGSLAIRVLDVYGIPYSETTTQGGELPNFDIKRMDAMQVIKFSLLEAGATQGDATGLYEPMVNSDGDVEFKKIGSYSSGVEGHIYYEMQTMDYKEKCTGVMVQGGKPLVYRKPVDWKPIWGGGEDGGPTTPSFVYDMDIQTTNCLKDDFNQYAAIVFPDPHMTDTAYEDGVDNFYEITAGEGDTPANPYDQIVGWVYYKEPPSAYATKDTEISYSKSSDVPIKIGVPSATAENTEDPIIGKLIKPSPYPTDNNPQCWVGQGSTADPTDGIEVPIPGELRFQSYRGTKVDTFVGISAVFLVGREIAGLHSKSREDTALNDPPGPTDCDVWATINASTETVYKLVEGTHYAVGYETDASAYKTPYVVFADLSRRNDPATYGNGDLGGGVTMFVNKSCLHYDQIGNDTIVGTVFPMAETKGIWVKEIWVTVQLNTPSIVISDPDGSNNRARNIAEGMEYLVSPIVIVDEPPPVAFNGLEIDMTQSIKDHDPTTAQAFSDTEYEKVMDKMEGGGLTLSLSFLDLDGCKKLSKELFNYMNSVDGVETVYVCGPACTPELGGTGPAGGVVNSINYSYTDSGSYTVSANEGAMLVGGFTDVSGGPSPKEAESISMEGTIVQDMGNHIHYKIRLDGFGERIGINCCPNILRVGDRVNCGVHNIPVEL